MTFLKKVGILGFESQFSDEPPIINPLSFWYIFSLTPDITDVTKLFSLINGIE